MATNHIIFSYTTYLCYYYKSMVYVFVYRAGRECSSDVYVVVIPGIVVRSSCGGDRESVKQSL